MQVGAQQLCDKVDILEGRDEDVAQGDDLLRVRACPMVDNYYPQHTFSCLRCLSSLSSLYVRLASTGVLKGFMIFLTATFWLVSWSRAELAAETACQQDDGRLAAAASAAATHADFSD